MATVSPLSPSHLQTSNPKLRLPTSTDPPSESNPAVQRVWLIFGATGHVGRSLTKTALSHGDKVTAVGRTKENTMAQMQAWHENCQGILCDVRVRETVDAAIKQSIKQWGSIDIIVNCTGYGVIGSCEDQDSCDLRSQFDTNFYGTVNILQLSLSYFREQSAKRNEGENAGRYIIFSSTSGALGVPGLGPYCATKYATEGLIESMLYEVDAFGIKATLVEPGHMRLDENTGLDNKVANTLFNEKDQVKLPNYGHFLVKKPSAPYDTHSAPSGHARRVVQWLVDRQPTSAAKSSELVWQLGHCRYPPLRLLLGSYAVESVRDRLKSVIEEIEDWKHLHFPASEEEGKASNPGDDDGEDAEREQEQEADAMDVEQDVKDEEG